MKTDFWASGNHFLPFFLNSSQLLLLEAVFHLTRTYWKRGFYLFCLLFHSKFFSVSGNQGAVHFLKTSHIPASRHQFFQFFQKFFKVEATFPCSENVFLMGFQPSGKSIGQCYFTASRNHYWYKEKTVLRERAHYCQWTTDFLAGGNHFISIFSEILASDNLFSVQQKRLFQRNPLLRLVETNLLADGDRFFFLQRFFLPLETVN